jgi:hypothetical protein
LLGAAVVIFFSVFAFCISLPGCCGVLTGFFNVIDPKKSVIFFSYASELVRIRAFTIFLLRVAVTKSTTPFSPSLSNGAVPDCNSHPSSTAEGCISGFAVGLTIPFTMVDHAVSKLSFETDVPGRDFNNMIMQ